MVRSIIYHQIEKIPAYEVLFMTLIVTSTISVLYIHCTIPPVVWPCGVTTAQQLSPLTFYLELVSA